jgi:hypothetical protein
MVSIACLVFERRRARVSKKVIGLFWVFGFIVALIGAGMSVTAIIAAANHCTLNQFGQQNCSLPTSDPLTYVGLIGIVIMLIGVCLGIVAWILALVRTAMMHTWGWFVAVLLLTGLGTLIYLLAGPPNQTTGDRLGTPYTTYPPATFPR